MGFMVGLAGCRRKRSFSLKKYLRVVSLRSGQPDRHHVAVLGVLGRLHHHDVAVIDHGVDHGIAVHFEGEEVLALLARRHQRRGDLDGLVRIQVVEV